MTEIKLTGLDGVVAMLQSLPAEVVSRRGGPVLAALRKGATVIRREEVKNLRRVTSNQTASGEKESTGLLAKSITVKRGKMLAGVNGERVVISVKRRAVVTTPDGRPRTGKGITSTVANAQRLEYGTNEQPAEPWIRPAFQAKAPEAIRTVESSLLPAIDKAVQRSLNAKKGR
jgi:HK97 gp10 family phage protein